MPAPSWRMSPARTISLCETASASAGASFRVGMKDRESLDIGGERNGCFGMDDLLRRPDDHPSAGEPLLEIPGSQGSPLPADIPLVLTSAPKLALSLLAALLIALAAAS